MKRVTTPTHYFNNLPATEEEIDTILITYKQNGKIVLSLQDKSKMMFDRNNIEVQLTQEQTKKFLPDKVVKVDVRLKLLNGQVLGSKEKTFNVEDVLDDRLL